VFLKKYPIKKEESYVQKISYYLGGGLGIFYSLSFHWLSRKEEYLGSPLIIMFLCFCFISNRMCKTDKDAFDQAKISIGSNKDNLIKEKKRQWILSKMFRISSVLGLLMVLFVLYG
jgi:hypothetical protein